MTSESIFQTILSRGSMVRTSETLSMNIVHLLYSVKSAGQYNKSGLMEPSAECRKLSTVKRHQY